jgi:polysaccharide deacetylase 2 family uncharacterized protein YibQ
MARRRKRPSRSRYLVLIAAGVALFALGFWAVRHRPAPPRLPTRTAAPAARARPAPEPVEAPTEVEELPGPPPQARVAIVVDDLGRSVKQVDRLLAIGVPMSYAVLPFESHTRDVVARLSAAGAEILVHLPMEPDGADNPGPHAILERLDPRRIAARTEEAVAAVPGAVGLNNHMGSKITADESAMRAVLGVVARHGLFFLDSRTTVETRAFDWARDEGIPAVRRDVFLDDDLDASAIAEQFGRLLELARANGAAVAIGHPHESTLQVLEREVPRARAAGVEFVPVSYLLERSESLPE